MFDPDKYMRLFEFRNYPLFYDSFWLLSFREKHILCINVDGLRTSYMPRSEFQKTLVCGREFFSNRHKINVYVKESRKLAADFLTFAEKLKEDHSSLPQLKYFAYKWFKLYSMTNFNYTDAAQKEIEENFPDFGNFKDELRATINKIAVGERSLLMGFIKKLSKQRNLPVEDLLYYTIDEMILGQEIDISERQDTILYYKNNTLNIITGKKARSAICSVKVISL